jgi:hypothetical protein
MMNSASITTRSIEKSLLQHGAIDIAIVPPRDAAEQTVQHNIEDLSYRIAGVLAQESHYMVVRVLEREGRPVVNASLDYRALHQPYTFCRALTDFGFFIAQKNVVSIEDYKGEPWREHLQQTRQALEKQKILVQSCEHRSFNSDDVITRTRGQCGEYLLHLHVRRMLERFSDIGGDITMVELNAGESVNLNPDYQFLFNSRHSVYLQRKGYHTGYNWEFDLLIALGSGPDQFYLLDSTTSSAKLRKKLRDERRLLSPFQESMAQSQTGVSKIHVVYSSKAQENPEHCVDDDVRECYAVHPPLFQIVDEFTQQTLQSIGYRHLVDVHGTQSVAQQRH